MKKNYKLDIVAKTLTITKEFNDKLNKNDEETWEIYNRLTSQIKGLKVVNRTHATPSKYHTKSGEVVKCNQYKYLTYDRMEAFIDGLPNGEEFKKSFDFLREKAVPVHSNGWTIVRRWFEAQFPLYRKDPLFYYYNTVEVIDRMDYENEIEKKKAELAKKNKEDKAS